MEELETENLRQLLSGTKLNTYQMALANMEYQRLIIFAYDMEKQVKNSVVLADVMPRTFSKQSLKDAYIQGYRKRAIMSGLKYDHISELNAVTEFENWFINLYGA